MAELNQTIHDARSGFHDITSLPEFHPPLLSLQTIIIIAIILALLALLVIIKKDKKTLIIPPPAKPDPSKVALTKLEEIRDRHSSSAYPLRELAAQISLILRVYYNDAYQFPADDRTALFEQNG